MLAAVVLAAGAAERFGSPKQRCFCPPCSRACAPREWTTSSSCSARTSSTSTRAPCSCPDWELGPGASLRCGLAALGRRSRRRSSCSPTGPSSRPAAIERVADGLARHAARRSSRPRYGGSRGHPLLVARELWDDVPDEGLRGREPLLVPCDDLGAPGDVDHLEDLPG